METPKLAMASIFNVQLYIIENASTQSGSLAIKDCVSESERHGKVRLSKNGVDDTFSPQFKQIITCIIHYSHLNFTYKYEMNKE